MVNNPLKFQNTIIVSLFHIVMTIEVIKLGFHGMRRNTREWILYGDSYFLSYIICPTLPSVITESHVFVYSISKLSLVDIWVISPCGKCLALKIIWTNLNPRMLYNFPLKRTWPFISPNLNTSTERKLLCK